MIGIEKLVNEYAEKFEVLPIRGESWRSYHLRVYNAVVSSTDSKLDVEKVALLRLGRTPRNKEEFDDTCCSVVQDHNVKANELSFINGDSYDGISWNSFVKKVEKPKFYGLGLKSFNFFRVMNYDFTDPNTGDDEEFGLWCDTENGLVLYAYSEDDKSVVSNGSLDFEIAIKRSDDHNDSNSLALVCRHLVDVCNDGMGEIISRNPITLRISKFVFPGRFRTLERLADSSVILNSPWSDSDNPRFYFLDPFEYASVDSYKDLRMKNNDKLNSLPLSVRLVMGII